MTDKTKAELEALIASIDDILALIGRNSLLASTAETLKSKRAEAQAALAAKDAVDPLLEEAETLHQDWIMRKHEDAIAMLMAALRRGMELAKPTLTREQLGDAIVKVFGEGERGFASVTPNNITALHDALTDATLAHRGARWPGDGRCKVPVGQTPLDDNLHHRLLDVIKEGQKARDDGTGSPYHGRSLEHCLHATGWVQRDLRLALDEAKAEIECLRACQTGAQAPEATKP
jgi:hypothetical protein